MTGDPAPPRDTGVRARRPGGRRRPARALAVLAAAAVAAVAALGIVLVPQRAPSRSTDACRAPAATAARPAPGEAWVASWGAAMQPAAPAGPSADGYTDRTLRQPARVSLGGRQVRVHLSNAFGDRALVVGAATVARCHPDGGARTSGEPLTVRWGGRPATTVPVGGGVTSDPVDLPVSAGTDVLVSVWFPEPTGPATWHATSWARSFVADGDATRSRGAGFEAGGTSVAFLDAVDVLTPSGGAVLALGDSITEGCCSAAFVDAHVGYPDVLAERFAALPPDLRMAVVDAGISGNRLLADGPGPSMTSRVRRDVLDRSGVGTVLVLGGVNDLVRSEGRVTTAELVAGLRSVVAQARTAGVRVVGATIMPFGASGLHTEDAERTRVAVNTWIRTSGTFDAVADLDATTRDAEDPTRLRAEYDSGDGLHPTAEGYAAMARAVRLADLRPAG